MLIKLHSTLFIYCLQGLKYVLWTGLVFTGKIYVPQAGIEPTALALGVLCSVHLSYWGVHRIIAFRESFTSQLNKKDEQFSVWLFKIAVSSPLPTSPKVRNLEEEK